MSIKVDTTRDVDYDYDQPEVSVNNHKEWKLTILQSIGDSTFKAKSFLPGDKAPDSPV